MPVVDIGYANLKRESIIKYNALYNVLFPDKLLKYKQFHSNFLFIYKPRLYFTLDTVSPSEYPIKMI